jgi:3alpha(or 20beta)-hydroxysteroid dehydrogenase
MDRLAGKVALVTGAARGSGEAIARLFASEGATVVGADVRDEQGEAAAAAWGEHGEYVHLDVTDEQAWPAAVEHLLARRQRLDVLVNNAAVLHLATIDATTSDAFEEVMRVNLLGAFLGTRACLPALRESGAGSIVNVGSIDSVQGTALTSAYTASKFGLRGLTKVTALENRTRGVRANIICPALGNPEMIPAIAGAGGAGERVVETRVRERAAPPDLSPVAEAACYLASDASRLCTGTELVLDRGASAGQWLDIPDDWFGTEQSGQP